MPGTSLNQTLESQFLWLTKREIEFVARRNKGAAQLALARVKLPDELQPVAQPTSQWTVAKVFDVYLDDLFGRVNEEWAI
jgi:hypothetical protein